MTSPWWTGMRASRSIAVLTAAVALALGACGSDDGDAAETGIAPTTTAAEAGEVTPVVVCADPQRGAAYFGYTNSGSAPVEIAVGEANSVTLPDGTELTDQQPEVFAPGEQGVVFWTAYSGPDIPPTWTVTGADGSERTASADDSAPECTGGPPLDPADDRVATVVGTVDSDGETATITITVEGLPDESRCPSGTYAWAPEAPEVSIGAVGANVTTLDGDDPATAQLTVDDLSAAPFAGFDVEGFTSIQVDVDVDDRCTDEAGVTSRAWGASESLRDLSQIGTRICFGAVDGGYDEVDCGEGPTLAPTGGIRSR